MGGSRRKCIRMSMKLPSKTRNFLRDASLHEKGWGHRILLVLFNNPPAFHVSAGEAAQFTPMAKS